MNTINSICPEVSLFGNCTKGKDCTFCSIDLNFNPNAKNWVPKKKRAEDSKGENIQKGSNDNIEKLNFNLSANEYTPKANNSNDIQKEFDEMEINEEFEEDEDIENDELNMIMRDIIDNEDIDEESDDEKWFPKFRDCECCKGFVYKCNGEACANLGECYCKMRADCDDEDDEDEFEQ